MISFPSRNGVDTSSSVETVDISLPLNVAAPHPEQDSSDDPLSRSVLASQFVSTDQEKADFLSLPNRYRRKMPRQLEIDSINVSFISSTPLKNQFEIIL